MNISRMLERRTLPAFYYLVVLVLGFVLGVGSDKLIKSPENFFNLSFAELLNCSVPAFVALIVATIISDRNNKITRRRDILDSLLSKLGDILGLIDSETTLYQKQIPPSPQNPPGERRAESNNMLPLLKQAGMFVSHLEKIQKDFDFLNKTFVENIKDDVMELRKLIGDHPLIIDNIPEDRWKKVQILLDSLQLKINNQRISLFS